MKKTDQTTVFGKPLQPFYRICQQIWKRVSHRAMRNKYIMKLEKRLEILYPNKNKKELTGQYICYKGSFLLAIVLAALLLSGFLFLQERQETGYIDQLKRNDYWGEEKEELLTVETEGEKEEKVAVQVSEQRYTEEEIPKILKTMTPLLEKTILKNNASLDCIKTDLNLVSEIPDTQVAVAWDMDTEEYMDYSGALIPGAVTGEGAVVNLTATLSYGGQSYIHCFGVHLVKPDLSGREVFLESLTKELELRNISQAGAEVLKLPDRIQGKTVRFSKQQARYAPKVLVGLLLCGVLVFFVQDEKLQKSMEDRKKQMMIDYSEIVSKLTLFLGAGMTIRSALEKLAVDYDKKKQKDEKQRRFAYDEILYVCREMQGGVSERAGIDLLGQRSQIPCYMKLCGVLSQNLKKGSKGMAQALGYEVSQAFEERKNIAKKLGEEAGTKLLFPMILMLVIVMVILIVPACLSF